MSQIDMLRDVVDTTILNRSRLLPEQWYKFHDLILLDAISQMKCSSALRVELLVIHIECAVSNAIDKFNRIWLEIEPANTEQSQ